MGHVLYGYNASIYTAPLKINTHDYKHSTHLCITFLTTSSTSLPDVRKQNGTINYCSVQMLKSVNWELLPVVWREPDPLSK